MTIIKNTRIMWSCTRTKWLKYNSLFFFVFIFCSFFMATRDVVKALCLTVVFIIIINEFMGKSDEEVHKKEKEKGEGKGASFNKGELEKAIGTLKTVQLNM